MGKLTNRNAVITGGAGGLGQAIARRFAQEGARVAVADRAPMEDTRQAVEAAGQDFLGIRCDVSNPTEVDDFASQVHARLGAVDIVVNNAMIVRKVGFEEVTFDEWSRTFATNIHGYFLITKAFLDDLKRSAAGRVINLTSTTPWTNVPLLTPYISTKGAINGFTNSLATELAHHRITVNSIAPSLIRTPATENVDDAERDFDLLAQMQSIKQPQPPESVGGMASFLASDDASFVTGQVMVVDGGLTRR